MTDYLVNTDFVQFKREYRRGAVLTPADLECWYPPEARSLTVNLLVADGTITAQTTAIDALKAEVAEESAKLEAAQAALAAADHKESP